MPIKRADRATVALAAVPPVAVIALVWLVGSDAIWGDEWHLLDLLVAAKHGIFRWSDYFALHNEHRIVPGKLLLTAIALLTNWNVRVELLASAVIASLSYGLVIFLGFRTTPARPIAVIAIAALSLFSLAQYENFLWGWQLSWFLAIALLFAAIALLSIERLPTTAAIALAAVSSFVATFTIGFGGLSWIVLLPMVAYRAKRRALVSTIWLCAAAASIVLYLAGDPLLPMHDPAPGNRASVAGSILFFFVIAGAPLTPYMTAAAIAGACAVALFALSAQQAARASLRDALPWISTGLFALAFAAMTTAGRASADEYGALSSRYATPAVLLSLAICCLAPIAALRHPRFRLIGHLVLVALLAGSLAYVPPFIARASRHYKERICIDLAFLPGVASSDCARIRSPYARLHRLETLRDNALRPFADASWFAEPRSEERVLSSRALNGTAFEGKTQPSALPRVVVLTTGNPLRTLALTWTDHDGSWRAQVTAALLPPHGSRIDAWSIEGDARRFTHVGSTRREDGHAAASPLE